jgi:hypothetical protein
MNVAELIAELSKLPPDALVCRSLDEYSPCELVWDEPGVYPGFVLFTKKTRLARFFSDEAEFEEHEKYTVSPELTRDPSDGTRFPAVLIS